VKETHGDNEHAKAYLNEVRKVKYLLGGL
jgi:hypothetical protein